MSMGRSLQPTEWNTEATAGMHLQVPLSGMLAAVPEPQLLAAAVIERATFSGCLVSAMHHCGKDDQTIAAEIHISQGYMSRFLRGVGQQWAKRLVAFMRRTNSLAPLQWIAHQVGCDVVRRDSRAAEVAALMSRLQELQGRAAA